MACCGRDAKWKREKIQDHKFDYIDVDDFVSTSCLSYLKYGMVYIMTLKSILSYMAELMIVILLILVVSDIKIDGIPDPTQGPSTPGQTNDVKNTKTLEDVLSGGFLSDPSVRIGLIIASVFMSYILLAFEWRKAFTIIQSRDISYAFTSTIAYRYYAIRSYPHFCVFDKINKSKKMKDTLSLWVYFRLKGWKKLIFAESPRQILNALNVWNLLQFFGGRKTGIERYFFAWSQIRATLALNVFAFFVLSSILVAVWILAIIWLVTAFIVYLFLLQSIRGNLKEYCVHKIDKRIDGLLKKKSRKRILDARKAELEELERNRHNGDTRAAPPLGMSVGPRYPNISLNNEDEAYGSEYGDTNYARSENGRPDMYGRAAPMVAPTRSEYGDDYQRSEYSGPGYNGYRNLAGANFSNNSEYSYAGLNPVYAGSVAGSQVGYHGKSYYEQAASEYGGSDNYTWQKSTYAASQVSYKTTYRERDLYEESNLPPVPESFKNGSSGV